MTINLTPGSIKFIAVRSRADTPMDTINDRLKFDPVRSKRDARIIFFFASTNI